MRRNFYQNFQIAASATSDPHMRPMHAKKMPPKLPDCGKCRTCSAPLVIMRECGSDLCKGLTSEFAHPCERQMGRSSMYCSDDYLYSFLANFYFSQFSLKYFQFLEVNQEFLKTMNFREYSQSKTFSQIQNNVNIKLFPNF